MKTLITSPFTPVSSNIHSHRAAQAADSFPGAAGGGAAGFRQGQHSAHPGRRAAGRLAPDVAAAGSLPRELARQDPRPAALAEGSAAVGVGGGGVAGSE